GPRPTEKSVEPCQDFPPAVAQWCCAFRRVECARFRQPVVAAVLAAFPRVTRPPLQVGISPLRERPFRSRVPQARCLLRWRDQRRVPLRFAAQQARLSRGVVQVLVLSTRASVVFLHRARLTPRPLHVFAAAVERFPLVRLAPAAVFPFQPAACFLSLLPSPALSPSSAPPLLACRLPPLRSRWPRFCLH